MHAGAGGESGAVMSDMMENMLRNPEMQKMLYPYLPEAMRNPSSIEWMLNNPEVRQTGHRAGGFFYVTSSYGVEYSQPHTPCSAPVSAYPY